MSTDTDKIQRFCRVFKIPDFLKPWLDRFFENPEIDLVLTLAEHPMTAEEIVERFSGTPEVDLKQDLTSFLKRSSKRGIIHQRSDGLYESADFHTRYDIWAMFEGWKDIPESIRERLNAGELEYSEKHYQTGVESMKKGQPREASEIYAEYILLHECEALLDKVDHVYLLPCNCRSMMQRCDQSVYTCLRFDDYRSLGWEISKSREKEIVQAANQKGLMQTAEVALDKTGAVTGAICNCCADCCVHPKLTERYDAHHIWPLSRYVAQHLTDRCVACGLCAKRCPFQAFTAEIIESERKNEPSAAVSKTGRIHFHKNLCRGCGVCSTACPQKAVAMNALDTCGEAHSLVSRLVCN